MSESQSKTEPTDFLTDKQFFFRNSSNVFVFFHAVWCSENVFFLINLGLHFAHLSFNSVSFSS